MLSHDDRTAADRAFHRALGAGIAEFPVTDDALDASAAAGDVVVLGAPNVVRGGSHTGAVGAEAAIRAGKCAVLASDYYYPAPLHAAFALAERSALPFAQAWGLISFAPAQAAGLTDRGEIAEGLRADLVVLCPRENRVVATLCAGRANTLSGNPAMLGTCSSFNTFGRLITRLFSAPPEILLTTKS